MSRKDYSEAARIIREAAMPAEVRSALVARFVTMFANDNPRFSPSRFRAACEPQEHPCRACGEPFPYDPDADYCPRCAAENAGDTLSERDRLEARGYRDGYAAATWFEPQDERTARWILDGLDAGDPEVLNYLPSPRLGGEWEDEPTWSNVLEDEGCEDSDDGRPELLDAYVYAYSCAAEREVVRACRALLGLVPEDLGVR